MFQVQLINKVVEWERRLQVEEEKRNNLKGKPYERPTVAVTEHKTNTVRRLQPAGHYHYRRVHREVAPAAHLRESIP